MPLLKRFSPSLSRRRLVNNARAEARQRHGARSCARVRRNVERGLFAAPDTHTLCVRAAFLCRGFGSILFAAQSAAGAPHLQQRPAARPRAMAPPWGAT